MSPERHWETVQVVTSACSTYLLRDALGGKAVREVLLKTLQTVKKDRRISYGYTVHTKEPENAAASEKGKKREIFQNIGIGNF